MSSRLVEVTEGLLTLAADRIVPTGTDLPRHYLQAARSLAETEFAAHQASASDQLDPSELMSLGGQASYTAMEAAQTFWGMAVRLRAACSGLTLLEAAAPLQDTLIVVAREAPDGPVGQTELEAASRALLLAAVVVDLACEDPISMRTAPVVDSAVHQIVVHGVLNLLRLAVSYQEDAGLR